LFHKILADESVDYRIVKSLREENFEVISILEECPSVPDKKVLELAKENNSILLTEDKDFGEWVFSYHERDVGIILLRYRPDDIKRIFNSLILILNKYGDTLSNKFAVLKINKIRIREI